MLKKMLGMMLVSVLLALSLCACGEVKPEAPVKNPSPVTDPSPEENAEPMKIYLLNGTTAMGAAPLVEAQKAAKAEGKAYPYDFELFAAADALTGAIVSGECDVAALPTNVAARLYAKSQGKVKLLAVNTLGVLQLLSTDGNVTKTSDLAGKTVYLPGAGSNPEYITAALFASLGLTGDKAVTLDTTSYPSPDALQTAVIAGKAPLAVLPEPKVTVVKTQAAQKGVTVSTVADLTVEWEKIHGENTLAQGCLVVNADYAKTHAKELSAFLGDYVEAVAKVADGSALADVVSAGILPNETVAGKALPGCHLCALTGNGMKASLSEFYRILFEADKTSIGALPDDGIYYLPAA